MNSKKPEISASLDARFSASLRRLTSQHRPQYFLIALSGGVDSVVLLSLATRLLQEAQASLRAVYIDHGLQALSTQWGAECAALCEKLNVDFETVKVNVDLHSGLSPEAAARDARYHALEESLLEGEYLCTAHHANDQAETLLLQLLRGSGVQGLAAMPECRKFGKGYLLRPLLNTSGDEIRAYARENALNWCEDPSNQDTRYDRNFLRNQILPALSERWPQAAQNLARTAAHSAEAASLIDELACIDLAGCADAAKLSISLLNSLSDQRRRNALRYWVRSHGYLAPSQVQLQQIVSDLLEAVSDSHGRVSFGLASVARYRDDIFIAERQAFEPVADFEYRWLNSHDPLYLPELDWQLVASDRKNLAPFAGQELLVRSRRGGERWQAPGAANSVSVKSLLQRKGVPSWQRSRLALVFSGDQLLDICGPDFDL